MVTVSDRLRSSSSSSSSSSLFSCLPGTRREAMSDKRDDSRQMDQDGSGSQFVGSIDQGTTSSRFMIFDSAGAVVASHQLQFPQLHPRPGYAPRPPQTDSLDRKLGLRRTMHVDAGVSTILTRSTDGTSRIPGPSSTASPLASTKRRRSSSSSATRRRPSRLSG